MGKGRAKSAATRRLRVIAGWVKNLLKTKVTFSSGVKPVPDLTTVHKKASQHLKRRWRQADVT